MKLAPNPFTHAIQKGEKQIGLWITLASNFTAEIIAPCGYDWVVIDCEHTPNDISSVVGQLQAFERTGTTAIVRPDWNDAVKVKRLLDIGAPGLLFPMVQNKDEAQAAVAATRYPPHGVRGVSGLQRANKFGRVSDYFQRVEDETTVIVQIETREALKNALEIGTVEGVTGVFFGPADIAADMGHLGNPTAKEVWDAIWPAARALMAAGVPVGTLVADSEFATNLLNGGFTFVACGSDSGLLAKSSDALLANVKAGLK